MLHKNNKQNNVAQIVGNISEENSRRKEHSNSSAQDKNEDVEEKSPQIEKPVRGIAFDSSEKPGKKND
jgi:hypothetical protein